MALEQYRRKRHFDRTPEPKGRTSQSSERAVSKKKSADLVYVIQKHDATRLHYDVRLELGGVMKSWAVPKGPSFDPSQKRMAVHVEDHPMEYNTFEGVIPKGEYGAGPVLVWDRGRWIPEGDPKEAYRKGKLKFRLEGEKLRGSWMLVRTRMDGGGGKESWLLIKGRDADARADSALNIVEARPESIVSGKTIEQIGPSFHRRAGRPAAPRGTPAVAAPRTAAKGRKAKAFAPALVSAIPEEDVEALPGARRGELAETMEPQLATAVEEVSDDPGWLHEIKYDGYRALCRLERGVARLFTRRSHDWTERFGAIAEAASRLPARTAMLDGEVVVLQAGGVTSFQALQAALGKKSKDGLHYFAFDLLYLDGWDLTRVPLIERKAMLARLLQVQFGRIGEGRIRYSDHVLGRGKEFFSEASRHGLEGILSKRMEAPYRSGRGRDWLKIRHQDTRDLVVCGFTDPEGSRSGFGSLVLGDHDGSGRLVHVGRVGTGFGEALLVDLRKRLGRIERRTSPFDEGPKGAAARGIHWVEPELVAEVKFTEKTRDGVLRHPSFHGLREDKSPEEVVGEGRGAALDEEAGAVSTDRPPGKAGGASLSARSRGGVIEVAGVRLTNPDKVLYPGQGITKRRLAEFYQEIESSILPYLAGRPLTLVRCPEGHHKECFYQKHHDGSLPQGIGPVEIQEGKEPRTYLYVTSIQGVVALVQMGVLELHVWGAKHDLVERPDLMIYDLDPDVGLPWARVIEAALTLRERLEDLGLQSFLKTTGGKGLHVCVPLTRRRGWAEVKGFSKALAEDMVRRQPDRYTSNILKAKRKGRIFVDYLRNGRGATAVSAYSTRARDGAPVSVPILWEELQPSLAPGQFTVENLSGRLTSLKQDPWAEFYTVRQTITGAMKKELRMERSS